MGTAAATVGWHRHSERFAAGATALLLQAMLYWALSERQRPPPNGEIAPSFTARMLSATRPNRELRTGWIDMSRASGPPKGERRRLLEAGTAANYQLETAMWIGAKLEQGVWYEMSAPLALPGMPQLVVPQQLEFAFTQMLPCPAGDAAPHACVELVIHATPDKAALQDVLNDLAASDDDQYFHYDASTVARIVVDPATLLPYARDENLYWYASVGKGKGQSILSSAHLVSTTTYGAQ